LKKKVTMKIRNLTLIIIMISTLSARSQKEEGDTTIYQFKVQSLDGEEFDFSTLKGKKNNGSQYCFKVWTNSSIQTITGDL
jgi:hypothetical protein